MALTAAPPRLQRAVNRLMVPAVAATLIGLAGCGGDDEKGAPLPRNQSALLASRLTEIQRRFDFGDGACSDIQQDTKPAVESALNQIPKDVDGDVRQALRESFDHLFDLAEQQCDETKNAPSQRTQTTPTPPPIQTAPPQTQPTQTQTQPKEEEKKKKKGKSNSGLPGGRTTPEGVPIDPD